MNERASLTASTMLAFGCCRCCDDCAHSEHSIFWHKRQKLVHDSVKWREHLSADRLELVMLGVEVDIIELFDACCTLKLLINCWLTNAAAASWFNTGGLVVAAGCDEPLSWFIMLII